MSIINLGTITNNYIFPVKSGYMLIDTGYENNYAAFCKELRKNNISLNDIAYVFLTHAHDDHAGFLNKLLHNTNSKVILHPTALEALSRGQNSLVGGCPNKLAQFFIRILSAFGKGEHRFPLIECEFENRFVFINDTTISDLENELSAKIIETPGHTECSISLYLNNGILFCGDATMNGLPSLHRTSIWIGNLNDYCSSWKKIIALDPKKIYPGHGRPFSVSDLNRFLPIVEKIKLLPHP